MEFIGLVLKLRQNDVLYSMKKETIIKFYQRYKIFIFPGVVTLSSLFLIVFAIYPQTSKLIANQKTQGELVNKSQFLETKAQDLENYDEGDLSRKVDFALNSYPSEKDFGNTIGLLQTVTAQSGFNIVSLVLDSGGSSNLASIQSFQVKVELTGTKALLAVLLQNLEGSNRLMRVSSVEISATSDSQKIDAAIVISVLYSPIPSSFGTIDSPLPQLSQKDEELITKLARVGSVSQPSIGATGPRGKINPFE